MIRAKYLNKEYTPEDKKLIALFQKELKGINQLFFTALQAGDRTKAHVYFKKMQSIKNSLKAEYGIRAELRIPEEYLKGSLYIDDHLNKSSVLLKLNAAKNKEKVVAKMIAGLGPVHIEAVKALVDNSKTMVSVSLDGMDKVAANMINQFFQAKTKQTLAEGMIRGDGLHSIEKKLTKTFLDGGITKFQDRSGRYRDMNRYVDMLTRTETKIANTQGTINRGLEMGISKYEVVEQADCCSICAQYNGKVFDISKGSIELPPYHPNCQGYVVIAIDGAQKDWKDSQLPDHFKHEGFMNTLIELENKGGGKSLGLINEASIKRYSGQGFNNINSQLRSGKIDGDTKAILSGLQNVFYGKGKEYTNLYRGTTLPQKTLDSFLKKGVREDKGFMSTSKEFDTTKMFLKGDDRKVILHIEKAFGIDISKYSKNPLEKEILLQRGGSFEIKKVINDGDVLNIFL